MIFTFLSSPLFQTRKSSRSRPGFQKILPCGERDHAEGEELDVSVGVPRRSDVSLRACDMIHLAQTLVHQHDSAAAFS